MSLTEYDMYIDGSFVGAEHNQRFESLNPKIINHGRHFLMRQKMMLNVQYNQQRLPLKIIGQRLQLVNVQNI